MGNGHKGVFPAFFIRTGGVFVGKMRPREVPARAPTHLKLNCDTLTKYQQSMQSTHTLFFGRVIGMDILLTARWCRRGTMIPV